MCPAKVLLQWPCASWRVSPAAIDWQGEELQVAGDGKYLMGPGPTVHTITCTPAIAKPTPLLLAGTSEAQSGVMHRPKLKYKVIVLLLHVIMWYGSSNWLLQSGGPSPSHISLVPFHLHPLTCIWVGEQTPPWK